MILKLLHEVLINKYDNCVSMSLSATVPTNDTPTHEMMTLSEMCDLLATTQKQTIELISSSDSYGCLLYRYLVDTWINIVLLVLGFIGNTLSIIIMWKDRDNSATSFLLIILAIADDLVLVVWTFQRALPATYAYYGWETGWYNAYSKAIETYGWALASVVHMLATWVVVLVTWQRYVAVCLPYMMNKVASVKAAKIQFILLVIVTVVFNVPRFLEVEHYWDDNLDKIVKKKTALAKNTVFTYLYKLFLYYLLIYVIPVFTLIFLTYKLIRHLAELRSNKTATANALNKADLTAALVVVVIIFLLCQLMNPIRRLLSELSTTEQKTCGYFYYYFTSFSTTAVNINSSTNFIVYCLCAPRFRKRLRNLLLPQNKTHPFSYPLDTGPNNSNNTGRTKSSLNLTTET